MLAYYILMQTIIDLARYREGYIPQTGPILARHNGKVPAATLASEPMAGVPPGAVTILRFPSLEAGQAIAADPDYQPQTKIWLESTTGSSAVPVPEFSPLLPKSDE